MQPTSANRAFPSCFRRLRNATNHSWSVGFGGLRGEQCGAELSPVGSEMSVSTRGELTFPPARLPHSF